MDHGDLFIEAIREARDHTPPDHPTGGVDAFLRCAPDWPPVRLAQECTRLVAELAAADQVVLHARQGDQMVCCALHPPRLSTPLARTQDADGFPWGIDDLVPSRFLAVHDAGPLPAIVVDEGSTTIAELGFRSAVHLPLRAGNRPMGALNLYWSRPGVNWDDTIGPIARALGVYTLEAAARVAGVLPDASLEKSP